MPEALVHRILAPSFVDGPGSRLAVFLQGCGLACAHCHNPETRNPCCGCGLCVTGCPGGALEQAGGSLIHHPSRCLGCDQCLQACPSFASPRCRTLGVEDLVAEVRPWAPFLDGITFTGGECTLQWEFLLAAIPALGAGTGLGVLLDTCGDTPEEAFGALAAVADGFLFDVKALGPAHERLTGSGNGRILRNLARAAAAGKVVEVRTVVIPGYTDEPGMLRDIAQLVRDLGAAVPLVLAPFRPQGVRGPLGEVPAMDPERMRSLCGPAAEVLGSRLRIR